MKKGQLMSSKISKKKRCIVISKSTGKRCLHQAIEGEDVCKIHYKWKKSKSKGGNKNARKHGAYSARLSSEEEAIYEKKKEDFTKGLGQVDVFDKQIVHFLALLHTKTFWTFCD